ncbi:DUF6318 family protein [Nocardioides sp.]|uniref:DUF6318 family protein n=1 Tax=Nocardioides sp. TaxID=35761 RepID=UPI002E3732C6|nr:DUF6318 family protein [Nocardioides sp.]
MSRTRMVVATVLVAWVLGACSDDDPKPDISDPTPSAPASSVPVSPSESSAAPTLSPEETVRAWVDAQNTALETGATADLRDLAASGCSGCDDFPKPIEDVYAAGGSFHGGRWRLINSHVATSSTSAVRLTAAVRIAGGTTVPAAGAKPVKYKPQHHLMSFELKMEADAWRFSAIAFVS